jgi:murein peptide amidase A
MLKLAWIAASAMAGLILFGIGGCARSRPSTAPPPLATRPSSPMTRPVSVTRSEIGMSVEGRPIAMVKFGEGDAAVLVLGAIHGDEPTSEYVARRLVEALGASPTPGIAVIPCANPDGLAAHRRTNARGVDLNRNFPAANWKRTGRGRNFGGREPLSEPESNTLHRAIESLHPTLIISIHSMQNPCDNYDGPGEETAELMSRFNGYPVRRNIGYPTPGSLGSWAGIDRQIQIITLELPRAQPGDEAWLANRDALLNAIASRLKS